MTREMEEVAPTLLDHNQIDELRMVVGRMWFDEEAEMRVTLCQHPVRLARSN